MVLQTQKGITVEKYQKPLQDMAFRNYFTTNSSKTRTSILSEICKTFPSVSDLANANEEQVLKLWQGLGYYSRARNLHFAAKQIHQAGFFPNEYKDIITLKGVGEYTAAAIASFAFKLPYAVVDGNVFRLLSRFYGIDTPIDTSKGKREFSEIAQTLLVKKNLTLTTKPLWSLALKYVNQSNPIVIVVH